jgi:hypothetical protein
MFVSTRRSGESGFFVVVALHDVEIGAAVLVRKIVVALGRN